MNYETILKKSLSQIQQEQARIYSQKLILTATVSAGSTQKSTVAISNYGHFYLTRMTGTFETCNLYKSKKVDDGICYLSGKLTDNSLNRDLFDSFVPLDLFLTPGRMKNKDDTLIIDGSYDPVTKTLNVPTPPAGYLFFPDNFDYLFGINSDIGFECRNTSMCDLTYNICFHGFRVKK